MGRALTRLVKPPTARQRENARRFNHDGVFVSPPASTAPASSWWVGTSRKELQERAAREQTRMALSRFGRIVGNGMLPD
ncbi:MAG TPA: hypothetical protein VN803_04030 [Gemmatimonadales bacterium]|nr:hypothetical protein [Gemmatimonadales bacterium]